MIMVWHLNSRTGQSYPCKIHSSPFSMTVIWRGNAVSGCACSFRKKKKNLNRTSGTAIVFHFVYIFLFPAWNNEVIYAQHFYFAANEMSSWKVDTQGTNESASFAFIRKWTTPNPAMLVSLHSLGSLGIRSCHRKEMWMHTLFENK